MNTIFLMLGAITGLVMGLLGIGGGIILVPGLIYLAGFSGHNNIRQLNT